MLKHLIYIVFSLLPLLTLAQDLKEEEQTILEQPIRLEFEIDKKDVNHTIVSAQEKGLFVAVETHDKNENGFTWNFYMVDTTLTIVWEKNFPISYGHYLKGYDYSLGNVFLLYATSPYRQNEMNLIKFDIATGDTTSFYINTVFPISLQFFEVVDQTIIMAGYTNDRPVLLTYNLQEQKPTVMPGYYTTNSDILDVIPDDELRTFSVVRSMRLIDKRYTISSTSFDDLGNELIDVTLKSEEEKSFLDGTSTLLDNGEQYIAGTYSRRRSDYSRGLYLAKIVDGRQQLVRYHNYGDLSNFFSYMRAKRENRVKERIQRRKVKGKKVKFNYRLLVHQIIERDDEYILVGEAYYPKYSSSGTAPPMSFYGYSPAFGSRNSLNSMGFIGYKYTHAVVVSFNKSGEINWDNSFEINDVLTPNLKKFVQISLQDERIILLYIYEGTIRSKIISGNEILEGKAFNDVKLQFESDELKSIDSRVEGLEEWYGKAFFAYGIQDIRNTKDQFVKLHRKIFYINKITYK